MLPSSPGVKWPSRMLHWSTPEDHYKTFIPNTGKHSHSDISDIPEDMDPQ